MFASRLFAVGSCCDTLGCDWCGLWLFLLSSTPYLLLLVVLETLLVSGGCPCDGLLPRCWGRWGISSFLTDVPGLGRYPPRYGANPCLIRLLGNVL